MTGGQEDEEAMNKEHQFWIKEGDIYRVRFDEEKRYDRVIHAAFVSHQFRPSLSGAACNTLSSLR